MVPFCGSGSLFFWSEPDILVVVTVVVISMLVVGGESVGSPLAIGSSVGFCFSAGATRASVIGGFKPSGSKESSNDF